MHFQFHLWMGNIPFKVPKVPTIQPLCHQTVDRLAWLLQLDAPHLQFKTVNNDMNISMLHHFESADLNYSIVSRLIFSLYHLQPIYAGSCLLSSYRLCLDSLCAHHTVLHAYVWKRQKNENNKRGMWKNIWRLSEKNNNNNKNVNKTQKHRYDGSQWVRYI